MYVWTRCDRRDRDAADPEARIAGPEPRLFYIAGGRAEREGEAECLFVSDGGHIGRDHRFWTGRRGNKPSSPDREPSTLPELKEARDRRSKDALSVATYPSSRVFPPNKCQRSEHLGRMQPRWSRSTPPSQVFRVLARANLGGDGVVLFRMGIQYYRDHMSRCWHH